MSKTKKIYLDAQKIIPDTEWNLVAEIMLEKKNKLKSSGWPRFELKTTYTKCMHGLTNGNKYYSYIMSLCMLHQGSYIHHFFIIASLQQCTSWKNSVIY